MTKFIPKIGQHYYFIMQDNELQGIKVEIGSRHEDESDLDFSENCFENRKDAEKCKKEILKLLKNKSYHD